LGIENKLANCKQRAAKPLTRDTIRLNLIAKIDKRVGRKWITIILNLIMIYHLLHLVRLEYLNLDPILKVSDNMDSNLV
jgi:hypothetical protein